MITQLITKSEAQVTVERIDAHRTRLLNCIETDLKNIYALINQEGKQQSYLDLLGTNAAAAMIEYAELRAWLVARRPNTTIPVPNTTVFQPQPDGTVVYVAPSV